MGPVSVKAAELMHESGGIVVIDADEFDPEIEAHMNLIDIFICAKQYYNSLFPSCDKVKGGFQHDLKGMSTAAVHLYFSVNGTVYAVLCDYRDNAPLSDGFLQINAHAERIDFVIPVWRRNFNFICFRLCIPKGI
jgi:hypothetical protein